MKDDINYLKFNTQKMNLHDSLEVEDLGRRLLLVEDILHLVLGGLISHPQALLGGFTKVLLILYDCTSAVKDILHLVLVHASSLVDVIKKMGSPKRYSGDSNCHNAIQ